ncbi:unnamed protein product [Prorocentrum cordatum]|uniref:Uncharacterized protein n=1 Tax=Prorocentrum cordatum TaxID=2364126 RepID=A0ABN9XNC3_9DINO|nr:unnamed protein product [Polarella glacialis]
MLWAGRMAQKRGAAGAQLVQQGPRGPLPGRRPRRGGRLALARDRASARLRLGPPDLMLVARTTGSPRFCGARAVRLRAVPRPPRVARGTERRSPPEAPRDAEAPLAADLPRRGCWAPLAAARPRRGWRRSADRPHSPAHSGAPGRALSGGARGLLAVDMAGTPGVANGRPARQNDR